METSDLIKELSENVEPVKCIGARRPLCILKFSVVLLMALSATFLIVGPRSDLSMHWMNIDFILETGAIFLAMLLSIQSAFILSVPGEERKLWTRLVPISAIALWIIFLAYRLFFTAEAVDPGPGLMCVYEMLALSVVPIIVIVYILKHGAPLKVGWVGFFAFLGVAAAAAFALQFTCRNSDAAHIIIWHALPIFVIAVIGVLICRRLLRW